MVKPVKPLEVPTRWYPPVINRFFTNFVNQIPVPSGVHQQFAMDFITMCIAKSTINGPFSIAFRMSTSG